MKNTYLKSARTVTMTALIKSTYDKDHLGFRLPSIMQIVRFRFFCKQREPMSTIMYILFINDGEEHLNCNVQTDRDTNILSNILICSIF